MDGLSLRPDAHQDGGRAGRARTGLGKAKVPLIVIASVASIGSAVLGAGTVQAADAARSTFTVPVSADTYAAPAYPDTNYGTAVRLVASSVPSSTKTTYLKFQVTKIPTGASDIRATLKITRDDHHLPGPISLYKVTSNSWTETGLTARNAPAVGTKLAEVNTDSTTTTVSLPISAGQVTANGSYSFAVKSSATSSAATFRSKESGLNVASLVLDYATSTTTTSPAPSPTTTTSPAPSPTTTSPAPSPTTTSPAPSPTATTSPSPVPASTTLCGAAFTTEVSGETYQQALSREDSYYNGLEMVRTYYGGAPKAWPGQIDTNKRPINVSFKFLPKDILSGSQDSYMTSWFATAPKDQDIYWTYYHEPEDNIAAGQFNATDYRAAWAHLRALADKAGNPRLKATLVLMGWSLKSQSGRNWRDYYPGRSVIQVLGWDVYNYDLSTSHTDYENPADMYKLVLEVSNGEGLPFAVAETGAYLVPGDSGAGRAAWLRSMSSYLSQQGALFVAYFDLTWPTGDFRLRDTASKTAWGEFCS